MSELKPYCEDCNGTGIIYSATGIQHVCHCQIKDISDEEMADIAIKEVNALRTENETLKAKVAELEKSREKFDEDCADALGKDISIEYQGKYIPDVIRELINNNQRMKEVLEKYCKFKKAKKEMDDNFDAPSGRTFDKVYSILEEFERLLHEIQEDGYNE